MMYDVWIGLIQTAYFEALKLYYTRFWQCTFTAFLRFRFDYHRVRALSVICRCIRSPRDEAHTADRAVTSAIDAS